MATVLKALANTVTLDYISSKIEGDKTVYTLKGSSPLPTLLEAKSKLHSVLNLPPDIPEDITITETKRGRVFRDFIVEVTVPRDKLGKLRDLIAKKYGLRRRPYSGEK